jgi:alpha-1,2-mannosyltransferase
VTAPPEAAGERRRRRAEEPLRPARAPRQLLRRALDATAQGHRAALFAVFGIAAAIRLAPLLRTGSLTGILGEDDGTYYSASAHLLRGLLPYRDVALDQTPGIAVLLLPFTVLATWAGDPVGLAAARVFVVLLGALNAVLVALLLRRYAPAYAIVGGLLYAVWRLPAAAERTMHLEAFAACGLLGSLLLLGTGRGLPPRRVAASGAALGATAAVTLGVAPAVAVGAAFLLAGRSARTAAAWVGGALAGFAALAGPLIVVAPSAFFRQAVHHQLSGETEATMTDRFRRFADLARLGGYEEPASIGVMVATCVMVAITTASFSAWWQQEARLAALITPVLCFVVAVLPGYHFASFALAPTLVIVLVTAAHRLAPRPWSHRAGPVAASVIAAFLGVLALTAVHDVVPRSSDLDRLRAFASGRGCVWFETASEAATADALTELLARGCPVPVDRLADFREQTPHWTGDAGHAAQHSDAFQQRLTTELTASDAIVLATDEDQGIVEDDARESVAERFRTVAEYHQTLSLSFWVRRR